MQPWQTCFSAAVTTDFRIRPKLRTMNRWMMTYGASQQEGSAHFRVWAPKIVDMAVKISGRLFPMDRQGEDFEADIPDVEPEIDYLFVLDENTERPDPVSRWQPLRVHPPSTTLTPT